MTDGNDFNKRNIAEFRANHGRVGGPFEGAPLVVLHTVGARSGKPRTNIMWCLAFAEYQRKTSRTIPVIALTPTGGMRPRE